MNWYKIAQFGKSKPGWIDYDGDIVPFVHNSHWESLLSYYHEDLQKDSSVVRGISRLIRENKLVRVYVDRNEIDFSLEEKGISPKQKEIMLGMLVKFNIFKGWVDAIGENIKFNSYKEFERLLKTI